MSGRQKVRFYITIGNLRRLHELTWQVKRAHSSTKKPIRRNVRQRAALSGRDNSLVIMKPKTEKDNTNNKKVKIMPKKNK